MPQENEPTLGEVLRVMEIRFEHIASSLQDLNDRIDRNVSDERYTAEQAHLRDRVAQLESARTKEEDRKSADRRIVITSFVFPLLLLVAQILWMTSSAA